MTSKKTETNQIISHWLATISAVICLTFAVIPALAGEPVALVTEVTGTISPPLEAFTEIEAGSSIDLGVNSRLDFLHYPTCQRVVAEGGKLSLTAENFRVNKGAIIDISKSECPQRVQLAANEAGAGIAGVVLRGTSGKALTVSQRPRFLLLGASAGQFKLLEILQGVTSVIQMPLDGKPLIWPEAGKPLQPEADYSVVLKGGDAKMLQFPLQVTNQAKQQMPAIIQIEYGD
ncbi:MAG TPA: hypothetical protein VFW37_01835 [Alphaproteobacteria bacterium]|nr:hypothetical protein [Alphaproteobacteria bacterium]